jgi:hypothetical protein
VPKHPGNRLRRWYFYRVLRHEGIPKLRAQTIARVAVAMGIPIRLLRTRGSYRWDDPT